ncbi:MAG: hypothetical protein ACSNEK_07125 [Parachlamydiaceae bacterium]
MSSKIENLKNCSLDGLYRKFNLFAKNHRKCARSLALPVALLTSISNTLTTLITAVEQLAYAAFYLIKAAFSTKDASLRKSYLYAQTASKKLLQTPLNILFSPIDVGIRTIMTFTTPDFAKREIMLNFAFLNDPAFTLCK